ncbi:acetolactate synthase catalytic subunit, partial [Staphylococcus aureus]
VFTGQVPTPGIGKDAFQEADILSMTSPITIQHYQVKRVEDIPKIVHEAFHVAYSGRKGPVVTDFQKNMGALATKVDLCEQINIPGYEVVKEPENKDIETFISLLIEATKPVELAGAGINQSKSNQLLKKFVNKHKFQKFT